MEARYVDDLMYIGQLKNVKFNNKSRHLGSSSLKKLRSTAQILIRRILRRKLTRKCRMSWDVSYCGNLDAFWQEAVEKRT